MTTPNELLAPSTQLAPARRNVPAAPERNQYDTKGNDFDAYLEREEKARAASQASQSQNANANRTDPVRDVKDRTAALDTKEPVQTQPERTTAPEAQPTDNFEAEPVSASNEGAAAESIAATQQQTPTPEVAPSTLAQAYEFSDNLQETLDAALSAVGTLIDDAQITDPAVTKQLESIELFLAGALNAVSAADPSTLGTDLTSAAGDFLPELTTGISKIDGAQTLAGKIEAILSQLSGVPGGETQELASSLQNILNKLYQLIEAKPQQTAATVATHGNAVDAVDPEIAGTLSGLLSGKDAQKKTAVDPALAKTIESTLGQEDKRLAVTTPKDAGQQNQNPTGNDARPAQNATSNTQAASTSAALATAATLDVASQFDSLLMAQSANQTGVKADMAIAMKPMTAAYQTPTPQLNMPTIAIEIARQVSAGSSSFQIRLDPPEMGKIDVKMDMDNSGNLHAKLTVERADTLDLLQRDSRALERALSQAGLDSSKTNLEFSLKQNPFAGQDGQTGNGDDGNGDPTFADNETQDDAASTVPEILMYRGTASPGGINLLA